MNIRHCLPKFIAVSAAFMLAATSSCFGTILNVPQYAQEKNNWCWCASSQMVLSFFSSSYSQTDIAQWAVGGQDIANYLYGSTDPNMHGCDEILAHFGNIDSSGLAYAMSLSTLDDEIEHTRPVIIRWGWDSGGGHILVLRGVDSESVYVNDPWYGQSINTYAWVCQGSSHTWTHTLQLSDSHSDSNYDNYVYYYNLAYSYYSSYLNSGSYLDLAYTYYYYAYAAYYYCLYYNNSSAASYYYSYYMSYAQYYYDLYQTQAYYYQYYQTYYQYASTCYSYYLQTGDYYYLAYTYYYYAYTVYCYYMYYGNSSYANYYYEYYMYWAEYYYEISQYYIAEREKPAA